MKIKISKSQWEETGKKAGWMKEAEITRKVKYTVDYEDNISKLINMNQQLLKIKNDFEATFSLLLGEKGLLGVDPLLTDEQLSPEQDRKRHSLGQDYEAVSKHLDNAQGRISTIISRVR